MSSQKTIKITPSFFSYSGGKSKGGKSTKTRKSKPDISNKIKLSSSKLKRNFIEKIKELKRQKQQKNEDSFSTSNPNENNEDDFNTSLSFMKNIISGEKQKDVTKNKMKNPQIHSESLGGHVIDFSKTPNTINTTQNNFEPKVLKSSEPNHRPESSIEITQPSKLHNTEHISHEETKPKTINKTLKNENKRMCKTIKLGKVKNKVSVLLRNQILKNKTDDFIRRLKSDDLKKIKEFLSSNGFIKYGSMAPEQLLREMYISIKTGGKLRNMKMDNYISKVTNVE